MLPILEGASPQRKAMNSFSDVEELHCLLSKLMMQASKFLAAKPREWFVGQVNLKSLESRLFKHFVSPTRTLNRGRRLFLSCLSNTISRLPRYSILGEKVDQFRNQAQRCTKHLLRKCCMIMGLNKDSCPF